MTDTHTAGPWRANENTVKDLDGRTLGFSAASEVGVEASEANARLMAAAPDLLAALKDALSAVEYYDEHEGAEETLKAVRAALSKAG